MVVILLSLFVYLLILVGLFSLCAVISFLLLSVGRGNVMAKEVSLAIKHVYISLHTITSMIVTFIYVLIVNLASRFAS